MIETPAQGARLDALMDELEMAHVPRRYDELAAQRRARQDAARAALAQPEGDEPYLPGMLGDSEIGSEVRTVKLTDGQEKRDVA